MKKILALLVLTAASLIPAARADSFEGKVTMKVTGLKNSVPAMTFNIKEGFSRIDITADGRNNAVILDAAKQQMTVLLLDQKMYITQAMPSASSIAAKAAAAGGPPDPALDITTTKEKILGYDCVKYVAQTKEGTSEIWVTDQLGAFLGFGGPPMGGGRRGPGAGAPAPQGWEEALLGKGVFPLRVVTTADGKETFRLEATNVEKTPLPAALFYPPSDFRNLSDMMRGMGLPGGIPGMPGGR